jgi:hypothetical protein
MDVRNAATFNISKQGIPSLSIDQERNVGIGIQSGISRSLHVQTNDTYAAKFGGTSGGDFAIEIGQSTSSGSPGFNATQGSMKFLMADTEAMRISDAGNVGIGTTIANEKLNVSTGTNTDVGPVSISLGGTTSNTRRCLWTKDTTTRDMSFYAATGGSSSDTVFYRNNTDESMRIDASGNVGIGTTNPEKELEVHGDGTTQVRLVGGDTGGAILNFGTAAIPADARIVYSNVSKLLQFRTNNGAYALNIDGTGNVGIGTVSPAASIDVNTTAQAPSPITFNGMLVGQESGTMAVGSGVGLGFKMRNSSGGNVGGNSVGAAIYGVQATAGVNQGELAFHTRQDNVSLDERMRIDASGNVLVGANTAIGGAAASRVQITHSQTQNALTIKNAGNSRYYFHSVETLSGDYAILNDATVGVKLSYGASAWSAFSDENLKENISDVGPVLDTIKDFQCVNYSLKATESEAADKVGFIAQDWEHTFPNVVSKDEEGTLSMKYTETIPVLLKAIQELTAKVEALENA